MNKLTMGKLFFIGLIAGGTTGMGNGSVFGAALLLFIGRGPYPDWGGWGLDAYNPVTHSGFHNWMMFVFGIAFMLIMMLAMQKHGELEAKGQSKPF